MLQKRHLGKKMAHNYTLLAFMFMRVVVFETAVSAIYSATYFAPRVIRHILSCSSVCDCFSCVLCRTGYLRVPIMDYPDLRELPCRT